jgi:hypothetical protein
VTPPSRGAPSARACSDVRDVGVAWAATAGARGGVSTATVSLALRKPEARTDEEWRRTACQVYVDIYVEASMGQVTLYMDEDTLGRMRAAAEAAGMSMSAWLAQLVRERTRTEWPRDVAALAGAWRSMPIAEELRGDQPPDIARETL